MEEILNNLLAEVNKYKKPAIPFALDILKVDDVLASKILGLPYWEKNGKIPLNRDGHPLQIIAQINLSNMPQLPSFPSKGILQFFINKADDLYGLNFDKPIDPKSNKVIYWADPSMDKYEEYPYEEISCSPANVPLEINPKEIKFEFCGASDEYYFEQYYSDFIAANEEHEDEIMEYLYEKVENTGSKIGGYAYFTQSDPRAYKNEALYKALGCKKEDNREFIVLLQLDSDHEQMMWGDCGVANWFILKEDLEKLDFSKVLYNWDCC